MHSSGGEIYNTYSIVARDSATGQFGVAVQTHQMCVGAAVPWLLPGVGAVATQSWTNRSFGPMALTMLREGVSAPRVIDALVASDPEAHRRQVAVVDARGRAAAWTGDGCTPEAMHQVGEAYSVQANMMTHPTVVPAMAAAYESAPGDLAQRMLAALIAAQGEGGDIRGMQSAALKVVPGDAGKPIWMSEYDLRVDEHDDPVGELARLVRLVHARHVDAVGRRALERGEVETALGLWREARGEAPELEELAFGQAVTLANRPTGLAEAVAILGPVLAENARRAHWLDLIRRMDANGMFTREGAVEELIAALG